MPEKEDGGSAEAAFAKGFGGFEGLGGITISTVCVPTLLT